MNAKEYSEYFTDKSPLARGLKVLATTHPDVEILIESVEGGCYYSPDDNMITDSKIPILILNEFNLKVRKFGKYKRDWGYDLEPIDIMEAEEPEEIIDIIVVGTTD